MKTNKQLNKELGIRHIWIPKDLEPLKDMDETPYYNPPYPYSNEWELDQPKKKKRPKKRLKKVVKKKIVSKTVIQEKIVPEETIQEKAVQEKSLIKKLLSWLS